MTYAELKSEIDALQAHANEMLRAEKAAAIADMQARIVQFGITASDLGFEAKKAGRPGKSPNEPGLPLGAVSN